MRLKMFSRWVLLSGRQLALFRTHATRSLSRLLCAVGQKFHRWNTAGWGAFQGLHRRGRGFPYWAWDAVSICGERLAVSALNVQIREPRGRLGPRGEAAAAWYLRRCGYAVVDAGVRELGGELDLVAVDGSVVVYVEVKTRRPAVGQRPADAVDREKRRRICRAASAFTKRHQLEDCPARFDIIEVVWAEGARRPEITHIPAAFEFEE